MPQVLLVVLALALASQVILQQSRGGQRTEAVLDGMTIQAAATAAAVERLDYLDSLPFDEGVKLTVATAASSLTPVVNGAFARTAGLDPAGDDLDDFNGVRTTVSSVLQQGAPAQSLTTALTVEYVTEAAGVTASAVPTRFKRATVVVTTSGTAPIRLSQLYSCGGLCAW